MTLEDIALTTTPGIGTKGAVHLLEIFGDARRIFAATPDELTGEAALRADVAQNLLRHKGFTAAEQELVYCRRHNITAIASTDPEYPALLRDTNDYPHMLYIKGDAAILSSRTLSIVGTREATPYGERMCNRLIEGLAARIPGLCIVSGLAFGIDAAAHRAALAAGVSSVGVLANPLPEVTPTAHTALAHDILAHKGTLISELHSQVKQTGNFYLARNRIIAALSVGTVVVESKQAGGALITAQYADGYNRTVMATPGRVGDPTSAGTNHLIRTRKAQMIRSADDIIDELMWDLQLEDIRERPHVGPSRLTADEAGLLGCFRATDPISIGVLGELSGLDRGELATLLIGLELAGTIRQLPGNLYIKQT